MSQRTRKSRIWWTKTPFLPGRGDPTDRPIRQIYAWAVSRHPTAPIPEFLTLMRTFDVTTLSLSLSHIAWSWSLDLVLYMSSGASLCPLRPGSLFMVHFVRMYSSCCVLSISVFAEGSLLLTFCFLVLSIMSWFVLAVISYIPRLPWGFTCQSSGRSASPMELARVLLFQQLSISSWEGKRIICQPEFEFFFLRHSFLLFYLGLYSGFLASGFPLFHPVSSS